MKMDEFRSNEKLVAWADKFMSHPNWKILMEVMQAEHPMYGSQEVVGPDHWDSKLLGQINGYNGFRTILEQARLIRRIAQEPEPVYEPPEAINK